MLGFDQGEGSGSLSSQMIPMCSVAKFVDESSDVDELQVKLFTRQLRP